jgi:hypothetical protein
MARQTHDKHTTRDWLTMSNRKVHTGIRVLLPLAAALTIAGAVPAAAQEPTALQKMLGALGVLQLPQDDNIVYRERPPLVVPPAPGLIAPRDPADIAKYNPDWPRDHDDRPRSTVDPEVARKADEDFYGGRPLLPSELSRGRISRSEAARRAATKGAPTTLEESQQTLSPTQLGFKGWNVKNEDKRVVFTGEPERRLLTDPPPGLRTPSTDAPYGVVTKERADQKAVSIYDRVTGSVDPNAGK